MDTVRISVRELVEFLLRSGDLDNRTLGSPDDAMLAGANMHRQLQAKAGDTYLAEVPLSLTWAYEKAGEGDSNAVFLTVEGRADGIYQGEDPLEGTQAAFVDEIKTTYRRLAGIRQPDAVHLAQAKCYAYIYAARHGLKKVGVRMTYCSLTTGDIRYFHEIYDFEEIAIWFAQLMETYRPWAFFRASWKDIRTASIREMNFPFDYRPGQKDLAAAVYRTIVLKKKLFLEAPTGTGKTISTLFPAIKAVGEGKADRIFYLTARTTTRTAAEDALSLLRGQRITASPEDPSGTKGLLSGKAQTFAGPEACIPPLYGGLRLKSVTLTAREKICVLEHPDCNPESCPRAKGHYDRINTAMYELLSQEDAFTRESITACAGRHGVCPFELGLDISLFCDLIIGDYNYVFDPRAGLRRFFGEGASSPAGKGDYLFLVDEAHNLVDRGREMYSAALVRGQLQALRGQVKDIWPKLYRMMGKCAKELLTIRRRMTGSSEDPDRSWVVLDEIDDLGLAAENVHTELMSILSKERIAQQSGASRTDPLHTRKRAVWEDLLAFYYDLDHFLSMMATMDDHYVIYAQLRSGRDIMVKLFCTDPSRRLAECMDRGRASILFSATLLPITYYKALLGGTQEDYEIYAQSVFDPERMGLFIVSDLSSRLRDRTPDNYDRIADCIHRVIRERHGNYMVFFPSYAFMEEVADRFLLRGIAREASEEALCDPERSDGCALLLRQKSAMSEAEREAFLERFGTIRDDRSLVGFCVMGGIFSEGIDLRNDRLIGTIVVGTGLPQICAEREILREYFDKAGDQGYDYAYRCPGMNKVQQAAGRVIRTKEDVGIVVLIDERFSYASSRRLFPREWRDAVLTNSREIGHLIERFWDEWL